MAAIDEQTLHDLEFDVIRRHLAGYCIGPTSHARVQELLPAADSRLVLRDLHRVAEFIRLRREGLSFPALDFEEIGEEIRLLQVRDSVLDEESFRRISQASVLVNAISESFEGITEVVPELWSLVGTVEITPAIAEAIAAVFDTKWKVRDDASDALRNIRTSIAEVRRQIARNFSRVMKELAGKGFLGDTGETFLNNRRLLAVFSTHKRKIPGIVVGSSNTGALTYIEPEVNIQLNFELEALFDDERTEVRRILQQLSREIRHYLPLLIQYQEVLTEFDFIQARARLALELDAHLPELVQEPEIDLHKAYHPLLLMNNKAAGRVTYPQTLKMDKFSRMLVISGPNAGGKSITMKTIGLLQVMLQSGLLVPCAPTSRMSFFQQILTDIGDNQSIENQLSTYSYRLRRMKRFLDLANRKTLVLLDEFGTGSDPDLGGALAEVFFEELYNRRSFGVITTHYGNIKLKAAQLRNAVNGCMLFNTETLEPTYKLSIGQPGSSFTFEVAEINGIPAALIEAAKGKMSTQKVQMDALLSSLQAEKTRLEELSDSARKAGEQASAVIGDFEKRKERYEDRLNRQAQTIERNNKFLAHGKRMAQFIEGWNLRAKNKELLEEVKKYIVMEKTRIDEERREKSLAKKVTQKKEKKEQRDAGREKIKVGSLVRLSGTKQTGDVLELEGSEAVVAIGVFRTRVSLDRLEFIR